jgi:hypothetical protein
MDVLIYPQFCNFKKKIGDLFFKIENLVEFTLKKNSKYFSQFFCLKNDKIWPGKKSTGTVLC